MQGFLNLDKPFGLTSHDCVARVRRLLKLKRVGHGGTLDPAATGVLPIALGRATRLLQYLPEQKAYQAKIRFGLTTTTDDLAGEVLTQQAAADLTLTQIQTALPQFQGTIEQVPPSYSAIQVGGQRLYQLARAGEIVVAPTRLVQVHQIQILSWQPGDYPELEVAIDCGSGTYIRSIARDLGAVLGTGGTLAALIRTASSGFTLAHSITIETLTTQLETNQFHPIAPVAALSHLPILTLGDFEAHRWQQGQRLPWKDLAVSEFASPSAVCQIQQVNGSFLGIGQLSQTADPVLMPKLVWQEE